MNQDNPFRQVSHQEIDTEVSGQRLDNFLLRILKGVPRSRIYRLIRKGEVRVNGKRARPETRLARGDDLRLPPISHRPAPSPAVGSINNLEALILYEDKSLLVINKPAGMAVHGGSGISVGVIESLRHLLGNEQLELVHRLDRGTSGCLMLTKRRAYLRLLQAALRDTRTIKKDYLALVHGHWPASVRAIDARLETKLTRGGERLTRVSETGKTALTRFRFLAGDAQASLVRASPVTGRTHQIRVHAGFTGHPVVGDTRYGTAAKDRELSARAGGQGRAKAPPRLMLHAQSLEIPALGDHPALTLSAPMDKAMSRYITQLFDIKGIIESKLLP